MNEINLSKLLTFFLIAGILIVSITGLFNIDFKAEKFKRTSQEVYKEIINDTLLVNLEDINLTDTINNNVFIDLRSFSNFEKGHINNAINIFAPTIIDSENLEFLRKTIKEGKNIILYSNSPIETNISWCFLSKLGFDHIKILNANTVFINNSFEVSPYFAEKLNIDITKYIKESNEIKIKPVSLKPIKKPDQVVKPVKKEKVEIEEGGC